MVRIGISGACGKMGQRIAGLAIKNTDTEIGGAFESRDCPILGADLGVVIGSGKLGVPVSAEIDKGLKGLDCLIEFTLPGPTLEHLPLCVRDGVAMVIGTTGIDAPGEEAIRDASDKIPVVYSPNMSMGVNTLFMVVKEAARVLGKDFRIKTDETHHVHKKDAPSGTAKMIAKVIKDACGTEPQIKVVREGEVIGNHGVIFENDYETLEIRHDAKTRDVFAAGALKAALFIAGKKPGLYTMADVLGIK